jgi:hypothetical protein
LPDHAAGQRILGVKSIDGVTGLSGQERALAIIPAEFVISRQMLHGVKARAERTTAADLPVVTTMTPGKRGAPA